MAFPFIVSSECTVILDKPPCCLEFYPDDPRYFVVGTYNLVDGKEENSEPVAPSTETARSSVPQQRDGGVLLCKLDEGRM